MAEEAEGGEEVDGDGQDGGQGGAEQEGARLEGPGGVEDVAEADPGKEMMAPRQGYSTAKARATAPRVAPRVRKMTDS